MIEKKITKFKIGKFIFEQRKEVNLLMVIYDVTIANLLLYFAGSFLDIKGYDTTIPLAIIGITAIIKIISDFWTLDIEEK